MAPAYANLEGPVASRVFGVAGDDQREIDTLKVCLNGQSAGVKERPTGFALDGHPAWRRLTFERIKPADATPGPAFVGLVLRFGYRNSALLLEGDADRKIERSVIPFVERVDLLKVAHNGSATSTGHLP